MQNWVRTSSAGAALWAQQRRPSGSKRSSLEQVMGWWGVTFSSVPVLEADKVA